MVGVGMIREDMLNTHVGRKREREGERGGRNTLTGERRSERERERKLGGGRWC